MEAQTQRLIPRADVWRLAKGSAEASSPDATEWRVSTFNDAAWSAATLPVFYGEPLMGTELTDMQNRYTSVFLRRAFTVSSPADVRSLILRVKVDDGFIAWINGREVARFGAPDGDLTLASLASVSAVEPVDFVEYAVALPKEVLKAGSNVLAIQTFNVTVGSSDLVLDAELEGDLDQQAPHIARILPSEGSVVAPFTSVEVLFDEPVQGVDASDLKVNGVPAQSVVAVAPDQYLFRFPQVGLGTVGFQFVPSHGITDLSSARRPFAGAAWSLTVEGGAKRRACSLMSSWQSTVGGCAMRMETIPIGSNFSTAALRSPHSKDGRWWPGSIAGCFPRSCCRPTAACGCSLRARTARTTRLVCTPRSD